MGHAAIDCRLMVFAKAPEPGRVKTRLIPVLGGEGAAALHRQLVEHALEIAQEAGLGAVELWCTPDSGDAFLAACAARHGATLCEQGEGDLGARMQRALAAGSPGILIGSDCPAMTPAYLREAAAALEAGNDAVLGPAEDGGYVLIGAARKPPPQLFAGIVWGGATVMQQTRAHLRGLAWRWQELSTLWDLDRPEDLRRMQESGLVT